MKKLLKGGRVINPQTQLDEPMDVLINGSVIEAIEKSIPASSADEVITLSPDQWVVPGLVDIHVHFRDPGRPDKETTATGAAAAITGGFTTVCIMPNTTPTLDSLSTLQYVNQAAERTGITIHAVAAVTKGLEGVEMTSMGSLYKNGAVAFTDDGHAVNSAAMMRKALEYSRMFNAPIVSHAQDMELSGNGVMHEGYYSTLLGLPGIPSVAESVMVARDIELARFTGGHVHFAHLTAKESVDLIRKAKAEGLNVTAETTPHNLTLTDAVVQDYDPNYKMYGPIRAEEDRQALVQGLLDGTIDAIATDHAPHTPEEKQQAFDEAPFGVIGLETALGIILTHFYHTGTLTASQVIHLMALGPAQAYRLKDCGTLEVGKRADITVIDPNLEWVVDPAEFKSNSRNTPFKGHLLKGKAIKVIAKGETLLSDAALNASSLQEVEALV